MRVPPSSVAAWESSAQCVVLDEPAASLDPPSEADLYKALQEGSPGCCRVLISHRMNTVQIADQILVLDNGTLVEQGTHEALMDAGGEYATLYNVQAETFARGAGWRVGR